MRPLLSEKLFRFLHENDEGPRVWKHNVVIACMVRLGATQFVKSSNSWVVVGEVSA